MSEQQATPPVLLSVENLSVSFKGEISNLLKP